MGVVANRVKVATATTGTGTVTLGAASSAAFCTFAEAGVANSATVSYCIEEGSDFEIGTGVYTTAGTTLTRATVTLSKIGGTSGTTKMTLAGAATVRVVARAEDLSPPSGAITSVSQTGGVGYATGAGASATQATNKTTGVTQNTITGQITMAGGNITTGATVGFTFTNSTIAATDVVVMAIKSAASTNSYVYAVTAVAAGSCRIEITNQSAGSLNELLVLNYCVIRGANT